VKDFPSENSRSANTPGLGGELSEEDLPQTEEDKKGIATLPFRPLIGRLWWLALMSRPDIHCALHKCALWQNRPSLNLWKRLLHIVKYLSSTPHLGIVFRRTEESSPSFSALCDASFATEHKSKSRLGWFFFLGGGLISWDSKQISRVVLSSTEAECNALVQCGKESVWNF